MANVSLKNTKAEILKAYQDALQKQQVRESNVTDIKARKSRDEAIDTTESLTPQGVVEDLNGLKGNFAQALFQLESDISKKLEEFQKIKQAVQIKTEEFKDISQIEVEYNTLHTLMEQSREDKARLEEEYQNKLKLLQQEFKEKKETQKDELAALVQEYARKREELEYNHSRSLKETSDEFEDLNSQLERQKEKLEDLENIEEKIDEMSELKAERKISYEKEKLDNHLLLASKNHETVVVGLQKDIDSYAEANSHLKQENIRLQKEVEQYREQVSEISKAALAGKSAVVNVNKLKD